MTMLHRKQNELISLAKRRDITTLPLFPPRSSAASIQRKPSGTPPPVYRPTQTSTAGHLPNLSKAAASIQRKPGGTPPPVYKPTQTSAAAHLPNLSKAAASIQRKPGGTPPPVYRPTQTSTAGHLPNLSKVTASIQLRPGLPPVPVPRQIQATVAANPVNRTRGNISFHHNLQSSNSISCSPSQTIFERPGVAPPLSALIQLKVVQRHPMVYQFHDSGEEVKKDTREFDDVGEVTRHLPKGAGSWGIVSIDIRQENRGDHQYVIVMTSGSTHIKMHWGVLGAIIEFGSTIANTYGIPKGEYTPAAGLTLSDVVGIFYQLANEKPFVFGEYDCTRLASDLASKLGKYKEGTGDDFDFF